MTLAEIEKLKELTPEQKRQFKMLKQSPVAFANVQLLPSEVTWVVTRDTLEQQMRNLLATYLEAREIQDVTLWREPGRKAPPKVIVWLRGDSKHLVDRGERRDDQMITPTVDRYSQEVKDMCDQFAPRKNDDGYDIPRKKRIDIIRASHDGNLRGIKLDFILIMNRLFDQTNRGFMKVFGNDSPNRGVSLVYNPVFDRRRDDGNIVAFRITKQYSDAKTTNRRPTPAFKDGRRT